MNQQKLLLLLRAVGAFSMMKATGVHRQVRVMRGIKKEWMELDIRARSNAVTSLYRSKLIRRTEHKDGSVTLVLTEKGKKRALRYTLEQMTIQKPARWDGKWRLVMYDIPEDMRALRLELLRKLKHLGFVELQHSVFAHPYECKDEIEYLIEAYDAREFIRRALVEELDSSAPLRKRFKLGKSAHSRSQTRT